MKTEEKKNGRGKTHPSVTDVKEMIRYFGNEDPTSRRLIEEILAKEEEHAEDLKALIEMLGHDERAAVVTLDPCGESFLDAYGAR